METKKYLGQIERLNRQIQNKLVEIYQLRTMACSVTVSTDKERVQSSGDKDKLGATVAKIVDLKNQTDDLIQSFTEKRNRIIAQIDSVDDMDLYHVLSLRYVSSCTFEEIAERTHWSLRKVFTLHEKAIKEFEFLFGHEYL